LENKNKPLGKERSAIKWSFYEKLLKRGVTFIVSMFLARLLEPSDFGLVAMLSVFTAFATAFSDFGFGQALIQKKDITQVQYSTVFYLNIAIGLIIFIALWLSAPLISAFYSNEILIGIVRYTSLSFIINSFTVVNSSILFKKLNYKISTVVMFYSSMLSGLLGVVMAFLGYGVWSLVWYGIFSSIIRAILLWVKVDWKPSFMFDLKSIKEIWKIGLSFLNIGIINNVIDRLDNLIIGKIFNESVLGFYNRAKSLQELPLYTFVIPITRPFFPIFAEVQEDKKRVKELMLGSLEKLNFIVILGFGIMYLLAENWIVILYSEKWMDSVPYFKILILLIPFAPFNLLSTSLFKGVGRLKLLTYITVLDRMSVFVAIGFAIKFDLTYYLWAFVICKLTVAIYRIFLVQKHFKIFAFKIFSSIVKMLLLFSIPAFAIEYFIEIDYVIIEAVVKLLLVVIGYLGLSRFFKVKGFYLVYAEVNKYLNSIKK